MPIQDNGTHGRTDGQAYGQGQLTIDIPTTLREKGHKNSFKVTSHKFACINLLLITISKNHLHSKYS